MAALALVCLGGAGTARAEPGTDEGSVGIQLLDAPVSRRDDPRASRYIVDHLPPGAVIQRNVLVANKSALPRHVDLYPAAATVEQGQFVFGAERAANELTAWTSLTPSALDLAPGARAEVTVTITVPPSAPAGERYAVLWASVGSDPASAGNVRQVRRIGVRVYLDVGAGGELPSSFSLGRLTASRDTRGRPVSTVEVTNTGGRAVDLSGTATLTEGPGGTRAGPFDVQSGTTLAPGQSGTVTVRFPPELPDGPWTVQVRLESGTVHNSASARISFSGETGEAAGNWTVPWVPIFGGVLVLALLTVGGMALGSRRFGRRGSRQVPGPAQRDLWRNPAWRERRRAAH